MAQKEGLFKIILCPRNLKKRQIQRSNKNEEKYEEITELGNKKSIKKPTKQKSGIQNVNNI